jgi:hypothetical protein
VARSELRRAPPSPPDHSIGRDRAVGCSRGTLAHVCQGAKEYRGPEEGTGFNMDDDLSLDSAESALPDGAIIDLWAWEDRRVLLAAVPTRHRQRRCGERSASRNQSEDRTTRARTA